MARSWRTGLVAGLAAAAVGIAGCGGEDGTIPRGDGQALLRTLDEVESKIEEGDCASAETDATQLVAAVNQLPAEVGTETKEALRTAAENLVRLVADQCEPETDATGASEVPTEPAPTEPTTTETTTEGPPEEVPGEGNELEPPEDEGDEGSSGEGEDGEGD